jgi:hypothetical protein
MSYQGIIDFYVSRCDRNRVGIMKSSKFLNTKTKLVGREDEQFPKDSLNLYDSENV